MSIYLLVLALVPCTDGAYEYHDGSMSTTALVDHDDGHSHEGEDDCPPFCYCACCGVSITAFDGEAMRIPKPILHHSYRFLYVFDYSLEYVTGIWHPPSVV